MASESEDRKRRKDQGRGTQSPRRRRRCDSVIDGTEESFRTELEHLERCRGKSTDIDQCWRVVKNWRARGAAAARDNCLEEFTKGLLGELRTHEGSPMVYLEVDASAEWPPGLKVARVVWESCTGVVICLFYISSLDGIALVYICLRIL
jgi:hypothetical protein